MIDIRKIRRIITGSLVCITMLMMVVMPQAALAASTHSEMNGLQEPEEVTQFDPADGVVRIQSGKVDDKGKFNAVKTFSGFVVSEAGNGGGVYIATTWHSIDTGQNAAIKVTVKNDTTVDANVEAYSAEQDFCILTCDSMKGRKAIPMRIPEYDGEDAMSNGSKVKALGFNAKADAGTEFSSADVTVFNGTAVDLAFTDHSVGYIKHDAQVTGGMDGGPLVDENGYIIGLNNFAKSSENEYQALQIVEIDKLLDRSGIPHRTRDKDALYGTLYDLTDKALTDYGKVKKSYKDGLKSSIEGAIKVMSESPYERSALQSSIDDLQKTLGGVEYKTPKAVYIIIALGVIIAALAARLISLIVWNKKYEKNTAGAAGSSAPAVKNKENKESKEKPVKAAKKKSSAGAVAARKPAGAGTAKLILRRTGQEYELDKNIITLGRSPEADVSIPDNKYIARNHAMIENRKGAFFLHDMGSTNGTFLNGQPVSDNGIRLITGDVIKLGNEEIDFK